ncbi:MAG: TonB-dependent receptor [Gammaproteobacteria bacterium]|nr:TonB-dependent receptor [Gammaproteobacteria bacterium]
MIRYSMHLMALAAVLFVASLSSNPVFAQADETIEEVVTVGTRSAKPRSAADSTVPIDVIGGEDFNSLGGTADLTDNLKAFVPSYNATPATGDGSAFVRPTSLRGTAPDQVLVLVNGKRRHRSALLHFFAPAAGNGAHGVDVGIIPGIALKSVEVLRDGAASQYGSDAIAGVINFVLKDADEGGQVQVQYGEHYEGEQSVKVAANAGLALSDVGWINASIEYVDNDALSRGIQRPDAQALIDMGVTETGQDAPFGDAPLTQTWGRPETEGTRFFLNSAFDISGDSQLYARFGLAETDGRYRFFYRPPDHSSLTQHRLDGFTGLPGGFTPFLDGDQTDTSFIIGVEGEWQSGLMYDFSYGYGKNELDYFLNNTVNPDIALDANLQIPKMGFDVGAYAETETNLNADFSLPVSDVWNLAFGAEWREEKYTIIPGEPDSSLGAGSSGFKGIEPKNSGEFERDNVAVYADVEQDVSDALLLQYAIRYENFSDFGNTINGKIAARYRFNDSFALRGAVSTGFHAPTPAQVNVSSTITTFDGVTGLQVEEGLVPSTDPRVSASGATALTEEESLNFSAGFTADFFDSTSLTLDVYKIEVDDRIYRTGDIAVPNTTNTISFYTNALDVEHTGVDVVVNSDFEWGDTLNTTLTFAYGYNEIEVTGQKQINGVNPVSAGLIEDIENNYPNHRFVLSANTFIGERANVMLRANYYGDHFDERGSIGAAVDPSAEIDATIYLDLEFGYQFNDNWKAVLGAVNITDEFIDEIGPPNANRLSVGLQYPRRSAANYEGGAWYLRGIYAW